MSLEDQLAQKIHDFLRRDFSHEFGKAAIDVGPDADWQALRNTGSLLWLDTGDMEKATALWNEEFSALTTNNTLLNNEIQKGLYDGLVGEIRELILEAAPTIDENRLILEIAFVLNAYHGLRLVEQFDANVSVELHTDLANDVERSVAYGKRYFAVCPERFIIKVPLTPAGYLAAGRLCAEGIPLNFTLGFSARQNYLAALLTQPTYVNVFMGRLNAVVGDHDLGSGENVGEKVTLATQRELLTLREAGRSHTQLIGASVRTGQQIVDLAGIDVFTMPPKAAQQYKDLSPVPVRSHVAVDPDIPLNEGVAYADFNGESLWDVPDEFKVCVDALLAQGSLDSLTAEDVQQHFHDAGFGDFLPRWTTEEVDQITGDGKIPVFGTWKDRLAQGTLGLDALMNMSALRSFTMDQAALDDRIRSVLDSAQTTG